MMLWLQSHFEPQPAPEPVDPWSLRKSPRIKSLLIRLGGRFDVAPWRLDAGLGSSVDGIYLLHPQYPALRAYLHVHGQLPGRAGLHLEFPAVDGIDAVHDAYDDLTLDMLAEILVAHFGDVSSNESGGSERERR